MPELWRRDRQLHLEPREGADEEAQAPSRLPASLLASYGAFGLPLAFLALPLYLVLPEWANRTLGLPLATVGAVLLLARLIDAALDPLLGLMLERSRARHGYRPSLLMALPFLALGFAGLFHPPPSGRLEQSLWLLGMLLLTHLSCSVATIAWQAWGAALPDHDADRARLSAWREGFGLAGVLLACTLPQMAGMGLTVLLLVGLLGLCGALLLRVPQRPVRIVMPATRRKGLQWLRLQRSLRSPAFRILLGAATLSALAAALPSTLMLFFVRDALDLEGHAYLFLLLYFITAVCALPLWSTLAARIGLLHSWVAGSLLALLGFVWVLTLPGSTSHQAMIGFALVCMICGVALAADLALPTALLARVIEQAGDRDRNEASYFGLWNFCNKLALALAAGATLPLLQWSGYTPGSYAPSLLWAYGLAPCLLKLLAACLLWTFRHRFSSLPSLVPARAS